MKNEWIRIETAIKRGEVDDTIINFIKLRIGIKKTFLYGVIKILEIQLENEEDERKRKAILNHIKEIRKSLENF